VTYPLSAFIAASAQRHSRRPSIYTAADLPAPLNRIDRDGLRRWAREQGLTVLVRRRDPEGRQFTDEVAIGESSPLRDVMAAIANHLNTKYHLAGEAAVREHLHVLAEATP
jgi:hypothetical protein